MLFKNMVEQPIYQDDY